MTSIQAVHLYQSQEQLERAGWVFLTRWSAFLGDWSVTASRMHDDGTHQVETFSRTDRADALAQALQWATNEEEVRHVA